MDTAPVGQTLTQVSHPQQSWPTTQQRRLDSRQVRSLPSSMTRNGQLSRQLRQPTHAEGSTRALGSALTGLPCRNAPAGEMTAALGHWRQQAPHSLHREGSMWCCSRRSPEIAPAGQRLAQVPQPTHMAVISKSMAQGQLLAEPAEGFPRALCPTKMKFGRAREAAGLARDSERILVLPRRLERVRAWVSW
jgi:hypothetical protein